MTTLEELKIVLESGEEWDQIVYLSHLTDIFESYNKNIQDFDEIMKTLIEYAIEQREGKMVEEVLCVITDAQTYQNIDNIDFSAFAENLSMVSGNVLFKYIEILSYTYDSRYIPDILKFEDHDAADIRLGVKDALIELRYKS